MSTVIRLKRRAIEEPLEGVILNCKKLRTDIVDDTTSDQNTDTTKLLKFSGTIKSQDDSVVSYLKKLTKDEAKEKVKKLRVSQTTEDRVNDYKASVKDRRFTIVNCSRTIDEESGDSEGTNKGLTIVDIEKVSNENENISNICPQPSSSRSMDPTPVRSGPEDQYVYDLYVLEESDDNIIAPNSILDDLQLSVMPYVYENEVTMNSDDEYCAEVSDDENSESNWRNDYPDTENSDDEENDCRRMFNNMRIRTQRRDSSDFDANDEEDPLSTDDDSYADIYDGDNFVTHCHSGRRKNRSDDDNYYDVDDDTD